MSEALGRKGGFGHYFFGMHLNSLGLGILLFPILHSPQGTLSGGLPWLMALFTGMAGRQATFLSPSLTLQAFTSKVSCLLEQVHPNPGTLTDSSSQSSLLFQGSQRSLIMKRLKIV